MSALQGVARSTRGRQLGITFAPVGRSPAWRPGRSAVRRDPFPPRRSQQEAHLWNKPLLAFVLACTGCYGIQGQHVAIPVDAQGRLATTQTTPSGLIVSGDELSHDSSRYFGALSVTFENRTADSIRVDRVALDFPSIPHNDGIFIPWGDDLASWANATAERDAIRLNNTNAALSAVALGGMAVATAQGRGPARHFGGLVPLSNVSMVAVNDDAGDLGGAQRMQPFGEGHLLTVPFSIPPGLFAKKWIVINTRGSGLPCITSAVVTYDVAGRGTERVELGFRSPGMGSQWQSNICIDDTQRMP